ncbi:Acyl-CoA N-acyltransferase [Apiospora hydei]|uniref:Acyl-CoA N-acyltransferase n=1 Tax=Apiospora hydei TaxID=1337664 RepID=A0ABR1WMX5_9PEZI
MTMPNLNHILSRATPADIPQLAAISARAFARDANTQMKAQGQKPGAFEEGMAAGLRMWIDLPPSRCVVLKAVDQHADTPGEGAIPHVGEPDTKGSCPGHGGAEATSQQDKDDEQAAPNKEAVSRIKQFEKMTSDHLSAFQAKIMPEGTRCLYIIAISVDPAAQGLGVGGRLVQWGTGQADRHGVFCWVHASEAGFRLFEGQGFREVERLRVDLDEWAVGRRSAWLGDGEGEEGWGRRYRRTCDVVESLDSNDATCGKFRQVSNISLVP